MARLSSCCANGQYADSKFLSHSYDGDDNAPRTSPQGLDPIAAEPTSTSTANQITEAVQDVNQENSTGEPYSSGNHDLRMNGNEQNGNNASGWGGPTNDYEDLPVEQDSHGTGIKEDG